MHCLDTVPFFCSIVFLLLNNCSIEFIQAQVAVKEKEQFVEFLQKQLEETKDNYQIEVQ